MEELFRDRISPPAPIYIPWMVNVNYYPSMTYTLRLIGCFGPLWSKIRAGSSIKHQIQSPTSAPFLRDSPRIFAHEFDMPLLSVLRMYVCFWYYFDFSPDFSVFVFSGHLVSRDPAFRAGKKKRRRRRRGTLSTSLCVQHFRACTSQKQRGRLDFCAVIIVR